MGEGRGGARLTLTIIARAQEDGEGSLGRPWDHVGRPAQSQLGSDDCTQSQLPAAFT